jgi:glucokinase
MNTWVVGVDLGGTKTALGLISPDNQIVAHRRIPTQAEDGAERVVSRIVEQVRELEQSLPAGQKVAALGICAPGPLDHISGMLINPTNLPKFYNVPLRRMLSDALGIPISLEHDAKAAALGEMAYGAGRGVSSQVYIIVGTGVGAAIIMDGQIIRGVRNFAGEVGHITIDPLHGEPCACGSHGCVETYMSGPWLERRYQRIHPERQVTGGEISQLAAQGDPAALGVLRGAGEALGVAVASMAMILDIELYIIGGSVARAGDFFLEPARQTAPKYSFVSVGPRIRIVGAELGEDGAILGSGWLARQALSGSA